MHADVKELFMKERKTREVMAHSFSAHETVMNHGLIDNWEGGGGIIECNETYYRRYNYYKQSTLVAN